MGPPISMFPTRTVKSPEGCPQIPSFLAGRNERSQALHISRCPCSPTKWRHQEVNRKKTQSSCFYNKCYIHEELGTHRLPVPTRDIPAKEAGASSLRGYCRDRVRAGRGQGGGEVRGWKTGEAVREGRESEGVRRRRLRELLDLRAPLPLILEDLGQPISHCPPAGIQGLWG